MAVENAVVALHDLDALNALAEPTRRRLYECVVAARRPVSREEAALAVGIERSLAAYHLDQLVARGLLEATHTRPPERRGPGAGRPAKRYARAEREFAVRTPPRDYRLLAELLVAVADEAGAELSAAIERAAHDFGRRLGERARGGGLRALLVRQGYEPVDAEQGTLRLRNCPFAGVAERHPKLVCGLNVALVDGMLRGLGADDAEAVLAPETGCCCVAIRGSGR